MRLNRTGIGVILLLCTFIFLQCASFLQSIKEQLNVLNVKFKSKSVALELLYPSLNNLTDFTKPEKYGINIIWNILATNPNNDRAVFNGADFYLRIDNTAEQAPRITSHVGGFSVNGTSTTTFAVTFPLTLKTPIFTKSVLTKVVKGENIPYSVSADLNFSLDVPVLGNTLYPLKLHLITNSLNTRPNEKAINAVVVAISKFL